MNPKIYRRYLLTGLWLALGGFGLMFLQAGISYLTIGATLALAGTGVLLTGIVVYAIRD